MDVSNADPNDVAMSQDSTQHSQTAPPAEESPSLPPDPSIPNPKPKKARAAPKAAPNADRPPGKSLLPISRVQKIMKADKELPTCAKEAVFLISVATEEFIKRLGQAGQQQAIREKRTTVQRQDVATAVRRSDEFVFLEEILAAGVSAPPPAAPVKRKPKATLPANDTMNIKEAFGKGKEKATESSDLPADDEESGRPVEGHDISNSGRHRPDPVPPHTDPEQSQGSQSVREGGTNDQMDLS